MNDAELRRFAMLGEVIGTGKRQIDLLVEDNREHQQLFDRMWECEHRAIKSWQDAAGRKSVLPDRAELILWLLRRLEQADTVIQVARELGAVKADRLLKERDAGCLHLALHVAAYDKEYPKPLNDPDADCCTYKPRKAE